MIDSFDQWLEAELHKGKQKKVHTKNIRSVRKRTCFVAPSVQCGIEKEAKKSDFFKLKMLGKGAFGVVYRVRNKHTHKIYAMKEIMKFGNTGDKDFDEKQVANRNKEIKIMYMCHHLNLLNLFSHFENDDYLYLIMELAQGGDLQGRIDDKDKPISIEEAKQYTKQIVDGLECLHEQGVIHRDLKPENIMIGDNDQVKIIDFGLSNFEFVGKKYNKQRQLRKTNCGTPLFKAPELLTGNSSHNHNVDLWALGCIIYEFITGRAYIQATTLEQCQVMITNPKYKKHSLQDFPCEKAKDLVNQLLHQNPNKRIQIKDIKKHPWIADLYKGDKLSVKLDKAKTHMLDVIQHLDKQDHHGFEHEELKKCKFTPHHMMYGKNQEQKYQVSKDKNDTNNSFATLEVIKQSLDEQFESGLSSEGPSLRRMQTFDLNSAVDLVVESMKDLPLSIRNTQEQPQEDNMNNFMVTSVLEKAKSQEYMSTSFLNVIDNSVRDTFLVEDETLENNQKQGDYLKLNEANNLGITVVESTISSDSVQISLLSTQLSEKDQLIQELQQQLKMSQNEVLALQETNFTQENDIRHLEAQNIILKQKVEVKSVKPITTTSTHSVVVEAPRLYHPQSFNKYDSTYSVQANTQPPISESYKALPHQANPKPEVHHKYEHKKFVPRYQTSIPKNTTSHSHHYDYSRPHKKYEIDNEDLLLEQALTKEMPRLSYGLGNLSFKKHESYTGPNR